MEQIETGSTGAEQSLTSESTTQENPSQGSAQAADQPIEIDNPDRYRYQGRTLKDWESGYMARQDYTQKTQALAQDRRYFDNLSYDLDRVRANPQLAEQFRQIYPEKFHPYLRYVLSENSRPYSPPSGQPQGQYSRLDPAYEARIASIESEITQNKVAAITVELDRKFEKLRQQYPYADEEAVVARAQALIAKMKEMNPGAKIQINDKQWDALWKSQHDRVYALSDAQYKKQVQNQIQANKKNADPARGGGGLTGQPPRQFRTIKEATTQALADIEAGSF